MHAPVASEVTGRRRGDGVESQLFPTGNALTEHGIVCSLSSGRIVAYPEITHFGVTSGLAVTRPVAEYIERSEQLDE
jgi:hypothetical protein